MGRLFWKFFFFFLLAQLTTVAGVGTAIWIEHLNQTTPAARGAFAHRDEPGVRPDGAPPEPHGAPTPFSRGLPPEPIIGGVIASLIFAALLAWYVAKPIRNLRSAFHAAAQGNLDVRLSSQMGRRRDELADLGREFDRTSIQLKSLMDGQRRLLHEVSHELRSPLARMQMAVGLARQQPDKLDEWMNRIERESERMDKLVDELLTLSRIEAGVLGEVNEEVAMAELVREVVADAEFEATASGRKVRWRVDIDERDGAIVTGRAEFLHRAVENIVRNAVKHTPDGGEVALIGRTDASLRQFRLTVEDEGPGVPESELASIFRPFFRGVGEKDADGHGVGLAIARGVVDSHGGTIRAANRAGGGLAIEIILSIG